MVVVVRRRGDVVVLAGGDVLVVDWPVVFDVDPVVDCAVVVDVAAPTASPVSPDAVGTVWNAATPTSPATVALETMAARFIGDLLVGSDDKP